MDSAKHPEQYVATEMPILFSQSSRIRNLTQRCSNHVHAFSNWLIGWTPFTLVFTYYLTSTAIYCEHILHQE